MAKLKELQAWITANKKASVVMGFLVLVIILQAAG